MVLFCNSQCQKAIHHENWFMFDTTQSPKVEDQSSRVRFTRLQSSHFVDCHLKAKELNSRERDSILASECFRENRSGFRQIVAGYLDDGCDLLGGPRVVAGIVIIVLAPRLLQLLTGKV